MNQSKLLILSGFSGVGKGEVCKGIQGKSIHENPIEIVKSVTSLTIHYIKEVSLYNLSESLFKKYRITFLANFLLTTVSHSANRMISAVPASKSNEISPHSPSLST